MPKETPTPQSLAEALDGLSLPLAMVPAAVVPTNWHGFGNAHPRYFYPDASWVVACGWVCIHRVPLSKPLCHWCRNLAAEQGLQENPFQPGDRVQLKAKAAEENGASQVDRVAGAFVYLKGDSLPWHCGRLTKVE